MDRRPNVGVIVGRPIRLKKTNGEVNQNAFPFVLSRVSRCLLPGLVKVWPSFHPSMKFCVCRSGAPLAAASSSPVKAISADKKSKEKKVSRNKFLFGVRENENVVAQVEREFVEKVVKANPRPFFRVGDVIEVIFENTDNDNRTQRFKGICIGSEKNAV